MRILFLSVCITVLTLSAGCGQRDLRGWWERSQDEKTYVVLEDSDGANCPPVFIDGQEVILEIGRKLEIEPGDHSITCGKNADPKQGLSFTVRRGTTYHFNYWGP
jgi:hypothetical protein